MFFQKDVIMRYVTMFRVSVVYVVLLLAHTFSTQHSLSAQMRIGVGAYAMVNGGINRSLSPLTRSEFIFSTLPAFGVEGTYSLNSFNEGAFVLGLGFQPYTNRSVSSDPFSGKPFDDFQAITSFNFLTASAGLRFHRVLGLSSIGVTFRAGLPLTQTYRSTLDVFEIEGEVKPSTGALRTYTLPQSRAETLFETLLDITPVAWDMGNNSSLSLNIQGGFVIGALVRFMLPRTIPAYYNIPGQDPLAGLRSFNVQPVSANIGLRYTFETVSPF
jgi:hypothetical protein